MRRAKRVGLIAASVLALVFLYGLWNYYNDDIRSWTAYELPATKPVRWWRCRGADRPMLLDSSTPWKLTYSWIGGFGPGDVTVEIESTGKATLVATPHDGESQRTQETALERHQLTDLAAAVDRSGLLCQVAEPRVGYIVHDLGRFTISVANGKVRKEVYFDGCHTLPDSKAFGEVSALLDALEPMLGEELSWGPFATTSMPGACDE